MADYENQAEDFQVVNENDNQNQDVPQIIENKENDVSNKLEFSVHEEKKEPLEGSINLEHPITTENKDEGLSDLGNTQDHLKSSQRNLDTLQAMKESAIDLNKESEASHDDIRDLHNQIVEPMSSVNDEQKEEEKKKLKFTHEKSEIEIDKNSQNQEISENNNLVENELKNEENKVENTELINEDDCIVAESNDPQPTKPNAFPENEENNAEGDNSPPPKKDMNEDTGNVLIGGNTNLPVKKAHENEIQNEGAVINENIEGESPSPIKTEIEENNIQSNENKDLNVVEENVEVEQENKEQKQPENVEVQAEKLEIQPENQVIQPENQEIQEIQPENQDDEHKNEKIQPENPEIKAENQNDEPKNEEIQPENQEIQPENQDNIGNEEPIIAENQENVEDNKDVDKVEPLPDTAEIMSNKNEELDTPKMQEVINKLPRRYPPKEKKLNADVAEVLDQPVEISPEDDKNANNFNGENAISNTAVVIENAENGDNCVIAGEIEKPENEENLEEKPKTGNKKPPAKKQKGAPRPITTGNKNRRELVHEGMQVVKTKKKPSAAEIAQKESLERRESNWNSRMNASSKPEISKNAKKSAANVKQKSNLAKQEYFQ